MPAQATVTVDLGKVRANARTVVDHLPGISVVAVTKVTCGSPQVGRAMLAGGARALGDSRLENAQRLRDAGLTAPIWLLRAPPPERAGETVQLTDVSLQSELETVLKVLTRSHGLDFCFDGPTLVVDKADRIRALVEKK